MSKAKFYYQSAKLGLLLLFCFGVGGALIYSGVAEKKGPVTFEDVYPGLAAIAAGVVLVGLYLFLSRPPANAAAADESPTSESSDA